jgi:hypothetical protein
MNQMHETDIKTIKRVYRHYRIKQLRTGKKYQTVSGRQKTELPKKKKSPGGGG